MIFVRRMKRKRSYSEVFRRDYYIYTLHLMNNKIIKAPTYILLTELNKLEVNPKIRLAAMDGNKGWLIIG